MQAHSVERDKVMGSPATVIVVGADSHTAGAAITLLASLEERWSRFLPSSEISGLNRAAGAWASVSTETFELIQTAVRAMRWTGGAFDPTMLHRLVSLGYDRDFASVIEPVEASGRRAGSGPTAATAGTSPGRPMIDLDPDRRRVRLSAGTGFDPGGIGKGLAADLVCARMLELGAAGAMVNLGGDLRVTGRAPNGDGWSVAAVHPPSGTEVLRLVIGDGAVATSSPAVRRWTVDGAERHHILDPKRGVPAMCVMVAASVVAATGWQAEVLCKLALLSESVEDAVAAVRRTGAHLVVTTLDGEIVTTLATGDHDP